MRRGRGRGSGRGSGGRRGDAAADGTVLKLRGVARSIDRVASFSGEFVQLPASDRGSKADLADGIEDGRAPLPSISYEKSMVDGIEALRAYEANIQAIDTTRSMIDSAIRVLA